MINFYYEQLETNHKKVQNKYTSFGDLLKMQRCSMLLKIVLLCLLMKTTICQNCYNSSVSTNGQNCVICLSNNIFYNCTFQSKNSTRSYTTYNCENYCCSYAYSINIYFCQTNSSPESSSTENTSGKLATILIIVFFSIPGVICIFIAICTCLKRNDTDRNNWRSHGNDEPPLSSINLEEFNIDQVGPLYQDATQACSICLELKCNIRTHCGHVYHSECLSAWIHKKQKCPLCVTKDFNPILLYCKKCFRSVKLCCLIDNMDENTAKQWKEYSELLCNICGGHPVESNVQQISLEISELQEQVQKQKEQQQINIEKRKTPIIPMIRNQEISGLDSAQNLHPLPTTSL